MSELKKRWSKFGLTLGDPWVFSFLIGTIAVGMSMYWVTSDESKIVCSIIFSISSGILGGAVAKRWMEFTEASVLVVRGKMAIRSLKLLLNSIASNEIRLNTFIKDLPKDNREFDLIRSHFKELVSNNCILKEQAVNSIENWTDVIPDADITTFIGQMTSLQNQVNESEAALEKLNEQLSKEKAKSNEEKQRLEKEVARRTDELNKAKQKLSDKQLTIDTSILGGMSGISGTSYMTPLWAEMGQDNLFGSATSLYLKCPQCFKPTSPLMMDRCKCNSLP